MKKLFSALSLALTISSITGAAHAGEAEVRKAAEKLLPPGAQIDSLRKTDMLGLYEVQVGPELLYIDEKGQFIIAGDIWDAKNRVNLTEERKNKLSQVKFSDLPLNMAIKQVRGNGKRVFVSFEDPNCGYCKRFAKETQSMTDVTHYVFIYPILGADSFEKSKNILCASDPAKTWNDWMLNGVVPPLVKACGVDVEKFVALGQRLNVRGTPNIILSDGSRIPGAVPAAQLEAKLNALAK
jgi:thiol:disulfide interchange protein DsbC